MSLIPVDRTRITFALSSKLAGTRAGRWIAAAPGVREIEQILVMGPLAFIGGDFVVDYEAGAMTYRIAVAVVEAEASSMFADVAL